MTQPPRYKRAVVLGGSMVGLAAARACASHFEEVIVVERDELAKDAPAHRTGVPQSWHIHNLILRGQQELDRLFPGYTEKAIELGALQLDHGLGVARCTELGWQPLFESGFIALSATRVLLEFAERVLFLEQVKNARVLEGTRVTGVLSTREGDRVRFTGVTTDHEDAEFQSIDADLVIDCTGRGNRWPKWFEDLDIPMPEQTVVDSHCGYSSRFYRPNDVEEFPWRAMVVDTSYPNKPHWGVIIPLENKEWVVTLGGFNGKYPPNDEEGFNEFAKGLISPLYWEALQRATPVTPVRTFRRMEMRWSHFERYKPKFSGFLAIGDSCWSWNPLYGQGMTCGIVSAGNLLTELDRDNDLNTIAQRYYPRAAKFTRPPWLATALRDMRWEGTTGKRPWHSFYTLPMSEFTMKAVHYDEQMFAEVLNIIHLTKQPHQIFTPRFLWGMTRYGLQRAAQLTLPRHDTIQLPRGTD